MNRKVNKAVTMTILVVFAIIQIFPLYWLLTYSLKTNAEILGDNILGLPRTWQFENYVNALTKSQIPVYFLNSVLYSAVAVFVSGLLASMASYALVRMKWKFQKPVMILFTIGIMIPTHATLLPLFQLLDSMGLKGGYMSLFLPYTAFAIPMSIMILSSFYSSLPYELEEAASIDGCGIYRMFFKIIFPMVIPALATSSIFAFLGTWNELLFANTMLDNDRYKSLPIGIMSFVGVYSTDLGLIGAGLVIATIPTIVIYILLSNQVQESLVAGAVKG